MTMNQSRFNLPIPFGWYAVSLSEQLNNGDVKPLTFFAKELVLFRTESGKAGVLDAMCPHLGAHMGHGGTVIGEAFDGRSPGVPPHFGEIARIMRRHAGLLADWFGERGGVRSFRKQATWYTKGFPGSPELRNRLTQVSSLADLDAALATADPDQPFPPEAMRMKRGKKSGRQRVALPEGYLDDRFSDIAPGPEADDPASGG